MNPTKEQLADPKWWSAMAREKYSYDAITGVVKSKSGKEIGAKNSGGYLRVNMRINRKRYDILLHRLIFLMLNDRWPEQIDHINGIKDDNRLENLREVDHSTNMKNTRLRSNSKTGVSGVRITDCGKFRVSIGSGSDRKTIGTFDNIFDAACARKSTEIAMGYHENHGKNRGPA